MNRNWVTGVALLTLFCGHAHAADYRQRPATDVPELDPLDYYGGNWDIELTIKNSEHPEGVQTTGSSVGEWIHDGRYLRQTWSVNAKNGVRAFNGSSIRTFDPRKKAYRTWSFDSAGNTEESQGAWNIKTRTLRWTVRQNSDGGTTIITSTFPEDGRETWSIVMKDGDGKIMADVSGTGARRKK